MYYYTLLLFKCSDWNPIFYQSDMRFIFNRKIDRYIIITDKIKNANFYLIRP